MALAEAIVKGTAKVSACPVGGVECAKAISEIMGIQAPETLTSSVAHIFCQKGCKARAEYTGISSCVAAAAVAGGPESCYYACLGRGDCLRACPFSAIKIDAKGMMTVDEEICTGCGICVRTCPKKIIAMVPEHWMVHVDCSSQDRGAQVRQTGCITGCIACGLCARVCPFKAIQVYRENELSKLPESIRPVVALAIIDYSLCRECGLCAARCPTKAIRVQYEKTQGRIEISSACVGCTLCAKNCPLNAITGEIGKQHYIAEERCIGCGSCIDKCPTHAISRSQKNS